MVKDHRLGGLHNTNSLLCSEGQQSTLCCQQTRRRSLTRTSLLVLGFAACLCCFLAHTSVIQVFAAVFT